MPNQLDPRIQKQLFLHSIIEAPGECCNDEVFPSILLLAIQQLCSPIERNITDSDIIKAIATMQLLRSSLQEQDRGRLYTLALLLFRRKWGIDPFEMRRAHKFTEKSPEHYLIARDAFGSVALMVYAIVVPDLVISEHELAQHIKNC